VALLLFLLLPVGKGPRPKAYHVPDNHFPRPSNPHRIDGPNYDEAYQRWLRDHRDAR
jgi:hypothetical protein